MAPWRVKPGTNFRGERKHCRAKRDVSSYRLTQLPVTTPAQASSAVPSPSDSVPSAPAGATGYSLLGVRVPRWFWVAAVLFLLAAARLAYHNSFDTDLALDNALVIGQDIRLREWKWEQKDPTTGRTVPILKQVFLEGYWYPSFPSDLYRPLTTITYAFNYSGPDFSDPRRPGPNQGPTYFWLKLVAFAVITGGLFLLMRAALRPWWLALAAAAVVAGVVSIPSWHWSLTGNGNSSYGYHVTNLLIHLGNVFMVLVVARRLTERPWVAVLAAAIFAVHPVETESVTNIVGRADQLCTLWILIAFWCYLRATVAGLLRPLWLIAFTIPATISMFSKESGFMLVLLLPLYDFIYRWPKLTGELRERLGKAAIEFGLKGWVALVLPVLFFFVIRTGMIEATPTYGQLFIDNPIARVPASISEVTDAHKLTLIENAQKWWDQITLSGELTAFKVLGRYLGLLVFPDTLSCDYSYNAIPLYGEEGTPLWENLQCWIGLAVVVGLLWLAWNRRLASPLFSFGVLFFFGMILLTANILIPIGSIMGERFLYLPSIGFCLVAALGLAHLIEKFTSTLTLPEEWRALGLMGLRLGLPLVLLAALGLRTYVRNADWKSEFTLWQSAAAAQPNSFKVHKGFANGYFNHDPRIESNVDQAIARAEIGLAVIDSRPLPINRQDNTLFCDLGMYYNTKAQLLSQPDRKGGPVPIEALRFYQKGVDIMIRARNVDTWVNKASRGDRLQRGASLDEIANVGNPRVHNQLAGSYLGAGGVHSQFALNHFDQFRRQLDDAAKTADTLDRISLETLLKNLQPSEVSVAETQKKLEDLTRSVTVDQKLRLNAAIQEAQQIQSEIRQMAVAYDEAIKAATYARNQTQCYLLLAQAQANSGKNEEAAITMLQALQLQAMQSDIYSEANLQLWESLRKIYASFGQNDAFLPIPTNPARPDVPRFQPNLPQPPQLDQPSQPGRSGNPVITRDFYKAGAGIVQLMLDAKDYTNAAQIKAYAITGFGIPESQLPYVPPVPPKSKFFDKIWKKVHIFSPF